MAQARSSNAPVTTRPTIRTEQAPVHDTKTELVQLDEKQVLMVVTKKPTPQWLGSLYSPKLLTIDEITEMYDSIRYIGFNRELMLYKLEQLVPNQKTAVQIIVSCALRGPQAASKLKMKNGKTIQEMGIPGSGKMGTEDLSCQRIASSTADLAAFYLKLLNVPKRINSSECPAWLQFPTAGSIKLSQTLRSQHIQFSKEFSVLIGGVFREDIYQQMVDNSYLNTELHLFD
jgi:hypothetical protein